LVEAVPQTVRTETELEFAGRDSVAFNNWPVQESGSFGEDFGGGIGG